MPLGSRGGSPRRHRKLLQSRATIQLDGKKEQNSLWAAFASVSSGRGLMLTVSGEAGIGKTTLIEDFLAEIEGQTTTAWVTRGRCSERLAETDAFAPILESLDDLRHGQSGDDLIQVMKRSAPAWYRQTSPDMNESGPAPAKESKVTSHERMRREFVYFLQELAAVRPVILFLDDLHWADASTCDLLAYLGTRMRNMRILVLTTCRPTSILLSKHPFFPLKLDLERRGLGRELALSLLNPADIEAYIAAEFPQNSFPKEFTKVVRDRTEGNPLFMVDMLRFLRDRAIVAKQDGDWRLTQSMSEVREIIPDSIQSMIQLKIKRIRQEDRRILWCAAVQGEQFDSAVIAQMLSRDPVEIEERLQQLEVVHNFVRTLAEKDFPNGVFSVRYQFVHVFYQNALYSSLTRAARVSLSLDTARALAGLTGDNSRSIAAELAVLFEAGRDYAHASQYFLRAARNAAGVFAYSETTMLCERGLRALAFLPESPERDARELMFSLTLGMALMIARGYGAPEVEKAYRRSRELCLKLNETRRLSPVLWGLHTCAVNTGDLAHALEVAQEMETAAKASSQPFALIESLHALGTTFAFMGKLAKARKAFEQIFSTYPVNQHVFHGSLYVLDWCVTSLSMWARLLALMGYPDQALEKASASVGLAERLAHPPSLAYATFWVGWIHHTRGEYHESCRHLELAMALAQEHGLMQLLEWARLVRGSSLTHLGRAAEGISEIRKSLDRQLAMRSLLERSYCLTLLAEALHAEGACEEALSLCDKALEFGQRTEGRCYEPETHRVRGEVLLSLNKDTHLAKAVDEFTRALRLADRMRSRLLELRAAISYFRLHCQSGNARDGRAVLTKAAGWFTEGNSSPVLREARELLANQVMPRR